MPKTINIKTPATLLPIVPKVQTLTVVVLNEKSQPTEGANVSITPSSTSGVTNSFGEVKFTLGNEPRYNITATADGKTVTVPYYVTEGGATRLVVNPVYVKRIEAQLHPSFFSSNIILTIGIGLGIVIFLIIFWKFFFKKKKRK